MCAYSHAGVDRIRSLNEPSYFPIYSRFYPAQAGCNRKNPQYPKKWKGQLPNASSSAIMALCRDLILECTCLPMPAYRYVY